MRSILFILIIVSLTLLLNVACEKDPSPLISEGDYTWEKSSASEQGLNEAGLIDAENQANQSGFVNSMLIVRNGYLVWECYFNGQDQSDAHNVMSVSKSFISALVGLALREGYLDSLDQKMMDFFPEYARSSMDPRKFQITIRHLLSMRAGFNNSIEDYDVNWNRWINSPDWLQYVINLELLYNPGTRFAYITAETHLLSAILAKATGMSTLEFAKKYLFNPMGIRIRGWDRDPMGYYTGGMGMYFNARDLARFGYLYLQDGRLEGRQIIPADWVDQSLRRYSQGSSNWGALENIGYGYLWWLGRINGQGCFIALGYAGQYIIVFPSLNLIVVATSQHNFYPDTADEHERHILDICSDYILPAVQN
jgi:CubicO group peptidase (beta-lactamase class C family)